MAWAPDIEGALRHLISAVKGMAASSPSGLLHPSLAAAEAAMTPPVPEMPDSPDPQPNDGDQTNRAVAEPDPTHAA